MEILEVLGNIINFVGTFFNKIFQGIVAFFNFIPEIIKFLQNGIDILPGNLKAPILIVLSISLVVLIWRALK